MTELAERPTLGPTLRRWTRPEAVATWPRKPGLGDGRHLGCGPSRRFSRAAVEGGPSGGSCSLGARLAWRSDPPIRVPSEPGGTYFPYGRAPSFFPEAGSIGERQEVSGLRRVGVNPPRHADAEVGRFEIAPAIDKPLSRQDPVGDVVRDAVTRRAVACHSETGSGELEVVLVGPYN